ncbi:hypothetical protein BJ508DRAFT_329532 [Ascobolus immersus RN42]|uniref:Uncharacterized protein n=1 Tax=Ascobolus immersus RN42 TaxID=1160509 RepID=A0A3N4HWC6_ASCIM|nr:hypothetical protein BJ508DRAFT_329532 [Ascobolus immersus RN42]
MRFGKVDGVVTGIEEARDMPVQEAPVVPCKGETAGLGKRSGAPRCGKSSKLEAKKHSPAPNCAVKFCPHSSAEECITSQQVDWIMKKLMAIYWQTFPWPGVALLLIIVAAWWRWI